MNKLPGKITKILSSESISLVEVKTEIGNISSVIVETPKTAKYLKIGQEIYVLFKETEVSIGKNLSGMISMRNKIPCIIEKIDKGNILSRCVLKSNNIEIISVITSQSVECMDLKIGDRVIALIKTNEVSLLERPDG